MLLKSKKPKSSLVAEGSYNNALVEKLMGKPSENDPKKIVAFFKIPNQDASLTKEWTPSIEHDSPLRRDVESILRRPISAAEAERGVDLAMLIGMNCDVIVAHKSGAGGKPIAVVTLVMPAQTVGKSTAHEIAVEVDGPPTPHSAKAPTSVTS